MEARFPFVVCLPRYGTLLSDKALVLDDKLPGGRETRTAVLFLRPESSVQLHNYLAGHAAVKVLVGTGVHASKRPAHVYTTTGNNWTFSSSYTIKGGYANTLIISEAHFSSEDADQPHDEVLYTFYKATRAPGFPVKQGAPALLLLVSAGDDQP